MNREYSVLYFSAPQLFNTLAKNAFDKNDIDAHNMCEYIFDCDLLIIDDLGTEYTNAFIASQFFTWLSAESRNKFLNLGGNTDKKVRPKHIISMLRAFCVFRVTSCCDARACSGASADAE